MPCGQQIIQRRKKSVIAGELQLKALQCRAGLQTRRICGTSEKRGHF
jgi:hypothetical protein